MNASLKSLLGVGLLAVALASLVVPAWANEPTDRVIKPGDILVVAAARAKVMSGDRVVTTVPKGQEIIVVEVRDNWIGTAVPVNKQMKLGWITPKDLVSTGKPVAAVTDGTCLCSCVELDDFLIGRIYRYETDPNMHVWEPWRHY